MDADKRKLAEPDARKTAEDGDAEAVQLDEYGHEIDPETGESISGPASPGYHNPDAQRLQAPEFAGELAGGGYATPGALVGHPNGPGDVGTYPEGTAPEMIEHDEDEAQGRGAPDAA